MFVPALVALATSRPVGPASLRSRSETSVVILRLERRRRISARSSMPRGGRIQALAATPNIPTTMAEGSAAVTEGAVIHRDRRFTLPAATSIGSMGSTPR